MAFRRNMVIYFIKDYLVETTLYIGNIFLCRWLPSSHEDLDNSCIIDKILSFDDTNADKVTKFKQMLKNER